ncbi:peroxisomal adenine nucleotide transporter 1 [Cordyceps fumosorosea ARSEF 2679]|uniref:Peroxisomal adenine nucleotide transporter 1 n=1 Tax=Cordyceps fumosorosea (strain ARSEF 2679) TaxID=1081104 RepID=A0A167MJF3_CORFA|nr:peroxisomal adenine nucleotide transporter 1 [Cordyceps fumosorosea ARSEF 2679]OAA54427.1 peroxisomal adenine nucleotide transporter 1 [Cordyceps fumosorosea ARSEF 2679]
MASSQALEALGHAISGSFGTATSTAALAPLDLVTTRLKVQRQLDDHTQYAGVLDAFRSILREEGVAAFYSGLGTDVAKSIIDSFLFFGFYNLLRQRSGRAPGVLREVALGMLAGAASKACTAPLSNVVARRQMTPPGDEEATRSVAQTLRDMRREGGVGALWAGYSATLVLTLNPSVTMLLNRRLAERVIPMLEEEMDVPVAWAAFLLAALSKSAATALTYPFQTAKTMLQMPNAGSDEDEGLENKERERRRRRRRTLWANIMAAFDRTIFGMILRLIRTEGIRALYDGMEGELLKGFFSHGLTMLAKGFFHRLVIRVWIMSHARRPLKASV